MHWLERCWYKQNRYCWLLLPLSALYWLIISLRRLLYKRGIKRSYRLPVPVIIVGNITVGGTGKTPFTLWLCQHLQQQGLQAGIISRGYGATVRQPTLVNVQDLATEVGDEPLLLARQSGFPVVVCPDRVAAAQFLLQQHKVDIIISDDGLQHYRLQRDLEIVLIDGFRGLGNGYLLPAGPLRETLARLQQVQLVVANSKRHPAADGVMQVKPLAALSLLSDKTLPPCAVTLVAGIGNPERFLKTAEQAGFRITASCFFPDHHQFTAADLQHLSGPVLMTEKDAVKCRSFARDDWYRLQITAEPEPVLIEKLDNQLTRLRRHYGV